jgi:uncharacterized damage-inducible protein DinB
MNRSDLTGMWDSLRQSTGIALRCVEAIPADQLDGHPIPNMRTPREIVVHTFGSMVRGVAEGALRGEIRTVDEAATRASIRTKEDLIGYCRDCWNAADRAVAQMTDAHLSAMVKTPWGMELPGRAALGVIHDEFFHHRGQLYAYLRAMGQDVPMMWDFEHNAPEFRPKARPTA